MTAPITSSRPTTTRLHHYAGRYSHGSGTPVETFFAHAWGSSTTVETFFALAWGANTTVETFFAHAHPKWLIFDHFHLAGAIFLSQRHPKRPPGATQGRSFFHAAPRDDTKSPRRVGRRRDRGARLRCRGRDETCPAGVDSGWDRDKIRPCWRKKAVFGVLCACWASCVSRGC